MAAVAILLTGISKGGFGQGAGGIAVPLMALFIAPTTAAMMLPILCAMDLLFSVHAYGRRGSREHLARLLPGAAAGIVGGASRSACCRWPRCVCCSAASPSPSRRTLGLRVTDRIAAKLAVGDRPPGRVAAALCGALSGFTSTLAHADRPRFVVYMLAQKADMAISSARPPCIS